MTIYTSINITSQMVDSFVPCRLYIKKLGNIKYFGKTNSVSVDAYPGSGKKWKHIIKKYGKENIQTIWVSDWYTDPHEIQAVALHFSKENSIVESPEWANLKPEFGIDGTIFTPGPKTETHKANMRKPKSSTVNMCVPKKKYTCPHCDKVVGGKSNFNRWHGENCTKNPHSPSYKKKHVIPNNPFIGGEIQRAVHARRKEKRLEKGILTREEKRSMFPKMHNSQIKWTCEHCGRNGKGSTNYTRWHSDNCKFPHT